MNLNFVFQGSQNLTIRVAISRSDVLAHTQFQHRMMGKLPALNPALSESLENFVNHFPFLFGLCSPLTILLKSLIYS